MHKVNIKNRVSSLKKSIYEWDRPHQQFTVTAKLTQSRCRKCRTYNWACHRKATLRQTITKRACLLKDTAVANIPIYRCKNNSNAIDLFTHFNKKGDLLDGDKFICKWADNDKPFHLILLNERSTNLETLLFLSDKSLSKPDIGPYQWYDMMLDFHIHQIKQEMLYEENLNKYRYDDNDLKDYAKQFVLSEYHCCLLFFGQFHDSWFPIVKRWRDTVYRMGGDIITIDCTFDLITHLHDMIDVDTTIQDIERMDDYDKRLLRFKIDVAIMTGLNKFHFVTFTALTPNKSEAKLYTVPPVAKWAYKCLAKSDIPMKGITIATDGLAGMVNYDMDTGYALKKLYDRRPINRVNIEQILHNMQVYSLIYFRATICI